MEIMGTLTIQPPKGVSLEEAKNTLKMLKFRIIKEEVDTYSQEFAEKIKQARKERKRGESIKISSENLWEIMR